MSKRSATDTIKGLNGDNKSGAIKQALDLIQNLEKSQAGQQNPEAMSALGAGNVAGMLKGLMGNSGGDKGGNQEKDKEEKEEELRRLEEEIERLKKIIEELEQEQQD